MASLAKFNVKAIALYGVAQVAEGVSAINDAPAGTITTTAASAAVTGSSTLFTSYAAIGSYLYTNGTTGNVPQPFTGSIATTTLTVTNAPKGKNLSIGQVISDTAGGVTAATYITAVISVTNGIGTYTVNNSQTVTSRVLQANDAIIGRIASVTSDTALTLESVVPASPTDLVQGTVMALAGPVTAASFKTGLGPKNAIGVLNLNFSEEIITEAFQYSGDELSRDEITVVKDTYAKFDFEAFLPVKGATSATPLVSEIPYSDWYQAIGMAVVTSAGQYKITNSVASNKFLTIEVRRSSPDIATQKVFQISDARGTPDFNGMMGSKPKLKFNFQGNLIPEVQKLYLVSDFRTTKTDISPQIMSTTIGLVALDLYTSNNTVEPTASVTSNTCFDKIAAPNFVGWEYTRYQTGCGDGWSKGAIPTDVTLTVLEDSADATYNPRVNISNYHLLTLKYGKESALTTIDHRITFIAHKLMLANVANSTVATYTGLDLKFRNTGTTDIIFS
jgi:hypothetical protein